MSGSLNSARYRILHFLRALVTEARLGRKEKRLRFVVAVRKWILSNFLPHEFASKPESVRRRVPREKIDRRRSLPKVSGADVRRRFFSAAPPAIKWYARATA